MKARSLLITLSAACAAFFCVAPWLYCQSPAEATATESSATATVAPDSGALRELDPPKESEREKAANEKASKVKAARLRHSKSVTDQDGDDGVHIGTHYHLLKGETVDRVVIIQGSAVIDGDVRDEVIAIASSVKINGHVHGKAVSIFSSIVRGPEAEIDGKKITVFGAMVSAVDGSAVGNFFDNFHGELGDSWFVGRPLGMRFSGWMWKGVLCAFVFYVFLAVVFRRPLDRCVGTLETSPGLSALAGFLALLLFPFLFVASIITVIGPVLLVIAILLLGLFGRVVAITYLGSRFLPTRNGAHPLAALLVGGIILILLYLIPVVGFLVWGIVGALGFGAVVYTMIQGARRPTFAKAVPPLATVPPVSAEAGLQPPQMPEKVAPPAVATWQRAGFWIRFLSLAIDIILLGILSDYTKSVPFPLLAIAYAVPMWTLKGTTIGGIICRLKVVRLDDTPVTWMVALVRALGAFLSFLPAGFGFIWAAFDDEQQTWHDKIAGTIVVRVPLGHSLV